MRKTKIFFSMVLVIFLLSSSVYTYSNNVIEIADDNTGSSGYVIDANTLQPVEGSETVVKNKYINGVPKAQIDLLNSDATYCIDKDKMYYTYYAKLSGYKANPTYLAAEKRFYNHYDTVIGYGEVNKFNCRVRLRINRPGIGPGAGGPVYTSWYTLYESSTIWTATAFERWYLFENAFFEPKQYSIQVEGKCDDGFSEDVDLFYVTLNDCQPVSCNPDFNTCSQGISYTHTFDKSKQCKETITNNGATTECQKKYCEEQGKYWYNNKCNTNPQCTPSWDCSSWGECSLETSKQARVCNDGCGNSKTETQSCTPVEPGPQCGDNSCSNSETCTSCPADCGECQPTNQCGNNVCEEGETQVTCPADCKPASTCGDGTCDKNTESFQTCPADCGEPNLCLTNEDCVPQSNPDKCLDYVCDKNVCKDVPKQTQECNPEPTFCEKYPCLWLGVGGFAVVAFVGIVILLMLGIGAVYYIKNVK